jgi:hypothetical protein
VTRTLWEGVVDTYRCRICVSNSSVYVQFLNQDGSPTVWPQPADGRFRDDAIARVNALKQAVVELAAERDRLQAALDRVGEDEPSVHPTARQVRQ